MARDLGSIGTGKLLFCVEGLNLLLREADSTIFKVAMRLNGVFELVWMRVTAP